MDLKYLKLSDSGGNAKYRRRVPEALQAEFGVKAVEWSLGTKDPLKIVQAYAKAHERFETKMSQLGGASRDQVEWDIALRAAVSHGLVPPEAGSIGPVDFEGETNKFNAFIDAILTEADKLSHMQMNASYANKPPPSAFELLNKAQLLGIKRPPVLLHTAVEGYLKDREGRSTYRNLSKQAWLAVRGLETAIGRENPPVHEITVEQAYTYRNSLADKGNKIGTIERRITSIKAILNHFVKRFSVMDWSNPFNGIEMPQDDGVAGEVKRQSLSLNDIRKSVPAIQRLNEDARDIWHLMMFSGAGPNELRGLLWSEVDLNHPTPHFEVRGNSKRRLKTGERNRRVPLVGSALTMMRRRSNDALSDSEGVFPRYVDRPDRNTVSAVLIKAMKAADIWVKESKVPYSLRHSMKIWLRRTTPTNIQLLILGHGHGEGRVASEYGDDDLLDRQARYMVEALQLAGVFEYPEFSE